MSHIVLFYWLSWLLWIIFAFFFIKGRKRTLFCYWILFTIMTSNMYVHILNKYLLFLPYLLLLAIIIMLYTKLPRRYYYLTCTFIMMIGYIGVSTLRDYTMVSLFIPSIIIVPLFCSALISLLTFGFLNRLIISVLGLTFGELFYSLIWLSYEKDKTIGDVHFFIALYFLMLFLLLFTTIKKSYDTYYVAFMTRKQTLAQLSLLYEGNKQSK